MPHMNIVQDEGISVGLTSYDSIQGKISQSVKHMVCPPHE